jgi:putative ABC transport system substrate-binding protein
MKGRGFMAATAALLIPPRRSWALRTHHRLRFLAVGDGSGLALNQAELALVDGLRSHSWIDGRNLSIDYRFSHPP